MIDQFAADPDPASIPEGQGAQEPRKQRETCIWNSIDAGLACACHNKTSDKAFAHTLSQHLAAFKALNNWEVERTPLAKDLLAKALRGIGWEKEEVDIVIAGI